MAFPVDPGGIFQATEPPIELLPISIEDGDGERRSGVEETEGVLTGRQKGQTDNDQRDMGRVDKRQELKVLSHPSSFTLDLIVNLVSSERFVLYPP